MVSLSCKEPFLYLLSLLFNKIRDKSVKNLPTFGGNQWKEIIYGWPQDFQNQVRGVPFLHYKWNYNVCDSRRHFWLNASLVQCSGTFWHYFIFLLKFRN